MTHTSFGYFRTSKEVIQLAVMMYVRFPLSLRNVEDLLHERGIDVCHESIRLWVDRFGVPRMVVTDKFRPYDAAMCDIGNQDRQNTEQYANNRVA